LVIRIPSDELPTLLPTFGQAEVFGGSIGRSSGTIAILSAPFTVPVITIRPARSVLRAVVATSTPTTAF
jgi:hypothetical protein